jgi:hypothetical protein
MKNKIFDIACIILIILHFINIFLLVIAQFVFPGSPIWFINTTRLASILITIHTFPLILIFKNTKYIRICFFLFIILIDIFLFLVMVYRN